jgi:hypothetical protein
MPSDDVLARHLQGWLLARGFVAVSESTLHEGAAVRMVDLARQPLRVRLVSDRGAWSMEVAGPDGHWIDLELWRDFLDGSAYSAGPSSFADCVAILRARLEEISALASSADFAVTAAALAALHRQRAVARYGVPL